MSPNGYSKAVGSSIEVGGLVEWSLLIGCLAEGLERPHRTEIALIHTRVI